MDMNTLLIGLLFLVIGLAIGFLFYFVKLAAMRSKIDREAQEIIESAKSRSKDIKNNAKNDAKQIIKEDREHLEAEFKGRQRQLADQEKELAKKESNLDQKNSEHEKSLLKFKEQQQKLELEFAEVQLQKNKIKEQQDQVTQKMLQVAQLTPEEIKKELVGIFTEEAKIDAAKMIKKIEEDAKEDSEKNSKRILAIAIQRFAGEYVAEQTISSVELPGDEIKGRLIGREGRNIRAFEQICGVDLVIDDTPGVVVISSFNVVRKEIARLTIERLIADGRIHPAKIEDFYERAKTIFDSRLKELGEKAQMEIGIHGIHPEVLKMIGALNWRTSYMQNQYQHSLEVAFLCGAMAAELGLNVKQARRAGLLHDIGKVMDASAEGSHAMVGADFLKRYGEHPDVVHAVRAHHEDVRPESVLAHLVMAADAMSGARPGIRKFMKESYVTRLSDIENIVNTFEGVSKSYALSAGREIRVLVENSKVSDEQTVILSRDIAKKIEEEMSYPGTIKISVIRETKAIGVAR